MGISWHPAVHALEASEVDYGAGVIVYIADARDIYRLSMQVIFSGYTNVTVALQASLDGINFDDVTVGTTAFELTASGTIISAEIGPYAKIQVIVIATLSGGADAIDVWLQESRLTR